MTTTLTTAGYDWPSLYDDLQHRGNVPDASAQVIDAAHAEVTGMYVDLADVKAAITQAGFDPPLVSITADVLNVPADTTWLLQNAVLFIRARRVQTTGVFGLNLDYRSGTTAGLVLFCQELDGQVRAAAATSSGDPQVFTIDQPPAGGGVQVCLRDGSPTLAQLDWAHGATMDATPVFTGALRTEFLFASLLFDQHPELAAQQLDWVRVWSGQYPELIGMLARSSSLYALLTSTVKAEEDGTVFVPYLTRQVYTDLATAFVAEAKQYESDYQALSTQEVVNANFVKLAKTLLANKTFENAYTKQLLAQAKSNFDNAVDAATVTELALKKAQREAEQISIDFEDVGVPAWKRAEIAKAVISLGTAVITFAVGIGATIATGGAAGPAAAGAAIETAKAAEAAAETGSAIANLAKKLEEVMKDLKKVGETLQKLYELSKTLVEVVGNFQHAADYADKMRELDVAGKGAELTASYQWQIYQQTSDAALQSPIDAGIEYADKLKLAVDAVAVYGQAVAAAHVAAITAGQRYAQVSLQKQLADQEQAQLQKYLDSLTEGEAPNQAMMQAFYQRYLDAKSSLFSAMENYRASYYYWALSPSSVRPAIIDPVDKLATGLHDLTSIALDTQGALERFAPPPQSLEQVRVVIDDPDSLAELASTGSTKRVIGLGETGFRGLDRVRITRVRAWAEGAHAGDGAIEVLLQTQGTYQDRLGGKSYQFTSRPLDRPFRYEVLAPGGAKRVAAAAGGSGGWKFDDGSRGYIVLDGAVDSEVSYAYFQPTPFTEWKLTVKGVADLSAITKVTMVFSGSAIPRTT